VAAATFAIACGNNTTSMPDAAHGSGGTDGSSLSSDAGDDTTGLEMTFECRSTHPEAGTDGPNAQCARGAEFCDDGKCYDLDSVGCSKKPTCLCVDHGFVNCHCSDDGNGAVTHLGCDKV
jgi:hypothetical protein